MSFKGYVDLDDTLYFLFTTRQFSTGAPFLLAGTPALSVYEENNATQITAGVSVSANYDSVTGLNQAAIVATTANGYEAGKTYEVVITTGTVDSVSVVGEVVGSFKVGPQAVNVTQISGDDTAANNLEAMYDGTGYTDATAPAARSQFDNITSGTAAISTTAEPSPNGFVITTGLSEANSEDSTFALDGTTHDLEDNAGTTDCYYVFDVGPNGVPVSVTWDGYVNANGDTWRVHAYNWSTLGWDQVGTLAGANGTTVITETYNLTTAHVGTGANIGEVRFRFESTNGTKLATDRILCSYAQAATGIANGSVVTLAATTSNTNLIGNNWNLALGGQDISGSYIKGASVTGISSGTTEVTLEDCLIGAATLPPFKMFRCGIGQASGTLTLSAAGAYRICGNSTSAVAGASSPVIDCTAAAGNITLELRGWHGGVTLNGLKSGDVVTIGGPDMGTITLNGADASVEVRGVFKAVTNNLTGAPTVTLTGAEGTDIADILADTNDLQTNQGNWLTATGFSTHSANDVRAAMDATSTQLAAILEDTGTTIPATITTMQGDVTNILADTNELQTDDVPGLIAALNNLSATDILGATVAELSAVPAASPTLAQAVALLFMALRNRIDVTASVKEIHDDAGTVLGTKTLTDDGTTYSETKMA